MKTHRHNAMRNFTLIELLAVLAIMVVVMAIALPAFSKMMTGGGVDAAARMVGAQLRLARQQAVTQRRRVALVMPGGEITYGGSTFASWSATVQNNVRPILGRAFRTCYVDSSGSFEEWVENTKWEFLPAGVAIFEVDQDDTSVGPPRYEFDMSGNLPNDGTITVVNGVVPLPAGNPLGDIDESGGADTINNVRAVIFRPTGRLHGSVQRTVTIGDGTCQGTGWIIREGSNWIDLRVNQYTGRVTFVQ